MDFMNVELELFWLELDPVHSRFSASLSVPMSIPSELDEPWVGINFCLKFRSWLTWLTPG